MKLLSVLFFCALFIPIAAKATDASLMVDIIECESSGRYNAIGDKGKSYGIVQFQRATFDRFKKKSKLRKLVYENPVHQLRLMLWMIDHGYGNEWSCYRKIVRGKK